MRANFGKFTIAIALLAGMWGLSRVRQTGADAWARPIGTQPGPVRILQFYANVGSIKPGEKALLCYGVKNARSVRIAPISQDMIPSANHCLEIIPAHTTHYTILAEGYDGRVAMKTFTLPVEAEPDATQRLIYAGLRRQSAQHDQFHPQL